MTMPVRRPGLALAALLMILVITAAWWAFALWPVSAAAPAWVVRTRAACFGTVGSGLPDAGGWILLVGEPIGMLAVLAVVWGRNLREDIRGLVRVRGGKCAAVMLVGAVSFGVLVAGQRVANARVADGEPFTATAPLPARAEMSAPALALIDQFGRTTSLADVRGIWAIVTFAFGQCETMCPLIVHDVLQARREAQALDVQLFVVTLDPWRDTPERLGAITKSWGLGASDRVLSGDIATVNATLDRWRISRSRDANTGNIVHAGTVIIVDTDGKIAWRLDGATHRVKEALRLRGVQ